MKIVAAARQRKLKVIATPFSLDGVDLLERVGVDAYKIASGDLTWDQLITRAASNGKPLIISTGMSSLDEVAHAVDVARLGGAGCDQTRAIKMRSRPARSITRCRHPPHFLEGGDHAHELINKYASSNLLLLDKLIPGITGDHAAVYEDFGNDIHGALEQALKQLSRYQTLKIIFPEYTYHAKDILQGFRSFCDRYAFPHAIISDLHDIAINKGDVFISLMEAAKDNFK